MAQQVGEISYVVKVDTSGMVTGIQKANDEINKVGENKSIDKFKNAMASAGKVAVTAIAGATTALAGLVTKSISSYAETEQLIGGIETIFGDVEHASWIMLTRANAAWETAGLSANEYMENVASFSTSLISSLGGDTRKAVDYADQAMIDMSDNANKFGTDIKSIQNAYQGFAKQNYTMLDNLKLGYGGTKTEMERLLADASKIAGIEFSIDSFADVTQAIHVMQESWGVAGTTAMEAETTISGSLNMLKASWENVLSAISDPDPEMLDVMIENLLYSLETFVNNVTPVIERALPAVIKVLTELAPKVLETLKPIVVELVDAVAEFIKQIIPDVVPVLVPVIIDIAFAILGALLQTLVDWAEELGEKAGVWLYHKKKEIKQGIEQWLAEMAISIYSKVMMIKDKILQVWEGLKKGIKDIAVKIGEAVSGAIKGAINKVLGFVEGVINTPINAINGLINVINAVPGINLGKLSRLSLPRLASGGIVESERGGSVIMAGEAGEDEWVVPESKMASMIEQLQARGFGGSNNITINVEGIWATSESQKRDVAQDIWEKINEINKSRMGAYL